MKSRLQFATSRDAVAELLSRVGQLPRVELYEDDRDEDPFRFFGLLGSADDPRWGALLADATDDEILAVAVRPHQSP
ncbi:MAG TPA: hypothetical protein VIK97_00485 [Casimicrobiaceae bacterium]